MLQRVKAIFRWAVIHGWLQSNPMVDLVPSEILRPREVAIDDRGLPAFLAKLDADEGELHTSCAMRLLMLTATRPREVRGARWDEIDLQAAVRMIPAERIKMRQEHRVPLSRQAVAVQEQMWPISERLGLVCPSPYYSSENTFHSAMARMGCT